jgi:hypothetical protein
MKRWLSTAVLLVLVAAGAVLWIVRGTLDGRLATALERTGTELLLAPVRVAGVDLDIGGGRGTIRGITVGNPEGFPDGTAISLREISLSLELGSLRESPIVVHEIHVGDPRVNVVLLEDGRMNIEALRRNAEFYGARRQAEQTRAAEPSRGADGERSEPDPRLRVREFRTVGGVIGIDASALGRVPEEIALGEVTLRDIGGARGVTPEELGRRVADALIARTARAVAGAEVKRALREKGGEIGEAIGELLQRGLDR